MRDYLREGRRRARVTTWTLRKARRILGIDGVDPWGWIMRPFWRERLREVGLDPESLAVTDELRWAVAMELVNDRAYERTFPMGEFKRRLAVARLKEHCSTLEYETESAPQDEPRRVMLENLGIEID